MNKLFRLLSGKRKPGVLELERYFPESHKRLGQPAHFGSKILSEAKSKIHAMRLNHGQWSQINAGKQAVVIHFTDFQILKQLRITGLTNDK